MNTELAVIVVALALIAAVTVWLLKKWAAKPNEWESKIVPRPEKPQVKPPEKNIEVPIPRVDPIQPPPKSEKPPPILPPEKPLKRK